jgi:hypothetical protein
MNLNSIIAATNNFVKEAELAAKNGDNVSYSKKNALLTKLGTFFMKGEPFEGSFKEAYEKLDKVTNVA